MKYGEQQRIFKTIPGLESAEFARLGGIHRNTFINSPKILNANLSTKKNSKLKFAGQITGVEGYVESAAIGLLSGIYMAYELNNKPAPLINEYTALGALTNYITNESHAEDFQPMNINFGLFPDINIKKGQNKKIIQAENALINFDEWKTNNNI
jgi:methylenetetrahydrofolate--tRNA-(uracil-5-)-methyltransferase